MPFARTKIQPPQPRAGSLIERPALEARLGRALLNSRLVLLVAPAGFGKTSALARALQGLPAGTAVAWIGCDVGDSPGRLFECLVAALEPYDPPWRTAPEALARSASEAPSPASRGRIASELINALDACEVPHGVIVVDDLHRIERPEVFEFIGLLLERFTPRWTFVISSREAPPLPLARLRATAEVVDLRADDLRFAPEEARSLAATAGLEAGAADRLYLRTQGWPAGLRLALSARTADGALRDGGAIDRAVFDFLADEVIDRQPEAMREFLLRTSVLPELTAGRCAALSGQADAALRLEELERSGLFVTPLAASEPTLRLHDLFREALQARLQRERPREIGPLLERAAATETDAVRRVSWLQRAESWAAAEEALAEAAEGLITQGQGSAVEALLMAFPAAQRENSPRLQLIRALYGWARWDWAIAIDASGRVAALHAAAGDREAERSARSYHCVALAGANRAEAAGAVQALLADPALAGPALGRTLIAACWVAMRGPQHEVALYLARMLDTLETIDNPARWYECSPLPPFVGLPGTRAPLQRYLAGVWRRLPEQPTPLRGMCQVVQAWLHLWVGEVEPAEACLDAAEGDARWLARPVSVDSYARALRSVLLALRGRGADALATAENLLAEIDGPEMPPARRRVYRSLYLFMAMRVAALLDERAALARHAGALARLDDVEYTWLSKAQRAGADAHLAWVQGDLDAACAYWRGLLSRAGVSDLYGQVVDARLRLADTLLERGRPPAEAAAVLRPLCEAIDASGEWGAVLLAGPALLERLAARARDGELEAAVQDRLDRWARAARSWVEPVAPAALAAPASGVAESNGQDRPAPVAAPARLQTPPLAVPLSARELEVLEHIAAGDSNKLIARAFDLSPHTVKRHVANILDKLALQSRGQAAAWYRARR